MRIKVCRKPNCSATIPYEQSNPYCSRHANLYIPKRTTSLDGRRKNYKQYNMFKRDKEANQFYQSKVWERLSRQIKEQSYFTCSCCGRTYDKPNYLITDHVIPRRVNKRKQLDIDNLWVLCKRCHYWKTQLEEEIYKSGSLIANIDTSTRWSKEEICAWILKKSNRVKRV